MKIGYSVSTLLNNIIKQAQEMASEAKWLEHYCKTQNEQQLLDIQDCVANLEMSMQAIKENLDDLQGEEM